MAGLNEIYPYRVNFPRTANWYNADWGTISRWCDQTFGPGEWEYFNSEFCFQKERDVMVFKLKWF